MSGFLARARFATLLAVALALMATGVVAGVAGAALIVGQTNDGGTSQTVLLNAGTGASFTLKTTNVATGAAGIFGWSSNIGVNVTRGVYGRADGANSYGVYAKNTAGGPGTGAALYADGGVNTGIVAVSAGTTAIDGTGTSCTGFLCGAPGVRGTGFGFTGGVVGIGDGTIAGVIGLAPSALDGFGIYGSSGTAVGTGVFGTSSLCNGVEGSGPNSSSVDQACDDGSGYFAAGGLFTADNGVIGQTATSNGVGVIGIDGTGDSSGFSLLGIGNAQIFGNLTIFGGSCTGCAGSLIVQNTSSSALAQGDAVRLVGVKLAADGTIVATVAPASAKDKVFGVVDVAMTASASTMKLGSTSRQMVPDKGWVTVKTAPKTVSTQTPHWVAGASSVSAGGYLRIITSGIFAFKSTATSGLAAGDALAPADASGKLAKAGSGSTNYAGTYLGKLADGRVVIFVRPS